MSSDNHHLIIEGILCFINCFLSERKKKDSENRALGVFQENGMG